MISKCICYNITFSEILESSKTVEELNICDKCRLCNPYVTECLKTGIIKFPVDYFKNYDTLEKDELE